MAIKTAFPVLSYPFIKRLHLMKNHLLGMVILAALGTVAAPSAVHAAPAQASYTSTIATVELNVDSSYQDIAKLDASQKVATHRFALLLPAGASLHPVLREQGQRFLLDEIQVKNQKGQVIGSIDSAWAQDASGKSLPTYFMIQGQTLVQTIDTSGAEEQSATAVLIYTGSNVQARAVAISVAKAYVGVPANYIYDLNHPRKSLHDWCTASPDEFPNPFGGNADFRGPCARHDMCYEAGSNKFTCDAALRTNMRSNCMDKYSFFNPVRGQCLNTADIYWIAVTANTLYPFN